MLNRLQAAIPRVPFHGNSDDLFESLYAVSNVCLPPSENNDILLFNLDIQNTEAACSGSACMSGTGNLSHIMQVLQEPNRGAIRFSFSKYTVENTKVRHVTRNAWVERRDGDA